MPKIKTNKTVYGKVRKRASGSFKRAQAFKSHNTARRSPKRRRQLRAMKGVDPSNVGQLQRLLPHGA